MKKQEFDLLKRFAILGCDCKWSALFKTTARTKRLRLE
jgi:hypothetical protein